MAKSSILFNFKRYFVIIEPCWGHRKYYFFTNDQIKGERQYEIKDN